MKKTVLILALGVLFVMVSFALALDDPNSAVRPERLDYYNQVEQAKSLYLDGGQLSHEQETILISEGIIPAPENELDETGGPDEFGYMYWDSQEVGGPVYSWIDISATGTVTTGWNADITQGPYAIGFDFSFYGVDYDQFYMCSHGWLSFSAGQGNSWTNTTLPNAAMPNNIVAIMWDDHIVEWFENMYYEVQDDGSLVIQVDQKYQAILFPNSDILLQYHEDYTGIAGSVTGETIGIENVDGTDGLQVSYNADPVAYPFGGLAILFSLGEENASVSGVVTDNATGDPVEGAEVSFGGYTAITNDLGEYAIEAMYPRGYGVSILADGFAPYQDDVVIVEGENVYDAELLTAASIAVDPDAISMQVPLGQTSTGTLNITNNGEGDLDFSLRFVPDEVMAYQEREDRHVITPQTGGGSDEWNVSLSSTGTTPEATVVVPDANNVNELNEGPYLVLHSTTITSSVQMALDNIGIEYDMVNTTDWDAQPLDDYGTVILAMDGGLPNLADIDAIETYLNNGGYVFFFGGSNWADLYDGWMDICQHTDQRGWTTNIIPPDFVMFDPDHPLSAGLPDEYDYVNNSASYYMFRYDDPDMEVAAENGDGWPCLISKQVGDGVLLHFTSSAGSNYWTNPADFDILEQVLQNMIDYSLSSWFSVDPRSGTVPGGETMPITLTADATDEEILPGVYTGTLFAESNDPDNPEVAIPVTVIVGPQLEITVTPWNDPTWVGPNGGSFRWDVTIDNVSDATIVYDAWTSVILPNGNPYGPMDLYTGMSLDPGEVLSASPLQSVPGFAPGGIYTFLGNVGEFPTVWAQDGFDWAKLPIPPGPAGGMDNHDGWVLTGWFDETEDVTSALVPTEFAIDQVYPNPFNPTTNISIALPLSSELQVVVFNVIGQQVDVLANGRYAEGYHNLTFDASDLSSGIYFIQATVPGKMNQLRKVVLMK